MSEPINGPEETPESPEVGEETPAAADEAAAEVPQAADGAAAEDAPGAGADRPGGGPTIRDKRRIDPVTGQPRTGKPDEPAAGHDPVFGAKVSELEEMVAERTADLQRLQAEYANYKKRVDRDRGLARISGVEAVVLDLLPVLDSVEAAREHQELVGGFKLVADELEKVSGKYGLEVFGEVGEVFDPRLHEALMHMPYEGEITETTISAVMQKGVRLNDRVLRPARVAVADPS